MILLAGTLAVSAPAVAAQDAAPGPPLPPRPVAEAEGITPADVGSKPTQPGTQGGGVQISVVVPGTAPTIVRGDSLRDPRDTRPPEIYGEELCPSNKVEGQFEPAQGTWQDDPTFADRDGKQLVRLSRVLFRAELKMVTGRWSLLHGVERAVGGAEARREEIFIKGEATGTGRIPVKFRFTLKQPGRVTVLYESEIVGEIPIGGPCRADAVLPWEVSLDAAEGIPPRGSFVFKEDGEYLLEAELVTEDGGGTGLKVGVLGNSVSTHAPSLAFRMVTILTSTVEDVLRPEQEEAVRELAERSALRIPDFFPIVNEHLTTRVFPLRDRRDLLQIRESNQKLTDFIEALGPELLRTYLGEAIREELVRELHVGGLMGGFDRIVVPTTDMDFRLLRMGSLGAADAVAFAASQKVVFVNLEVAGDVYTVAHEIAHTIPFSFAEEEMVAECGLNYHGLAAENVAHGHQVSFSLRPRPARRDNSPHVMGAYPKDVSQWIEQCTYKHLLEVLSTSVPDPRVLLVQGFVGRNEGRSGGFFMPFYDLDGIEDLAAGGPGSWAIVLKDADGDVLSRHAWEPRWHLPHVPTERKLAAFAFRLLWREGLARVELEGPAGILDTRALSASAPSVRIVRPAAGEALPVEDRSVAVEWSATDDDGDSLLYTVLYSPDGGQTWHDVVVETAETTAFVQLDADAPPEAHRVLVRATDGGRSADASVTVRPAE